MMLKLTRFRTGGTVYLNTAHIVSFSEEDDGSTLIRTVVGDYAVKQKLTLEDGVIVPARVPVSAVANIVPLHPEDETD